jgi:hypothetical protein
VPEIAFWLLDCVRTFRSMISDDSASPTLQQESNAHEVQSILASLKGIVSITMGLALTNTIVVLVTHGTYTNIVRLSSVKGWEVACSFAVVASIIRFYHGNNRFMDTNYAPWGSVETRGRGPAPRGGLGVDFLVIFTQSVMFAVISFYSSPRPELALLFALLLTFDIFWYLTTTQVPRDPKAQKYHQRWQFNNFGFALAFIVCYFMTLQHKKTDGEVAAILISLNTVIDFAISWELYFGSFRRSRERSETSPAV